MNEIILIIQMRPVPLQRSLQAKEEGRSFIVTEYMMTEAEVTMIQLLALKMDSEAKNQGMQPVSKSWKREGSSFPQIFWKEGSPADTLILAQ